MDDKERIKIEQMALRCRTAYRELLKLAADMQQVKTYQYVTENITASVMKIGKVFDILNAKLAENGIILEEDK